jgi:hypothetical protein
VDKLKGKLTTSVGEFELDGTPEEFGRMLGRTTILRVDMPEPESPKTSSTTSTIRNAKRILWSRFLPNNMTMKDYIEHYAPERGKEKVMQELIDYGTANSNRSRKRVALSVGVAMSDYMPNKLGPKPVPKIHEVKHLDWGRVLEDGLTLSEFVESCMDTGMDNAEIRERLMFLGRKGKLADDKTLQTATNTLIHQIRDKWQKKRQQASVILEDQEPGEGIPLAQHLQKAEEVFEGSD